LKITEVLLTKKTHLNNTTIVEKWRRTKKIEMLIRNDKTTTRNNRGVEKAF
jgi:hypothetical protein